MDLVDVVDVVDVGSAGLLPCSILLTRSRYTGVVPG